MPKKSPKKPTPKKKADKDAKAGLLDDLLLEEDSFLGDDDPSGKNLDDVEEYDDEDDLLDQVMGEGDDEEDEEDDEETDEEEDGADADGQMVQISLEELRALAMSGSGGGRSDPKVDEMQQALQELGEGLKDNTAEVTRLKNSNRAERERLKKKERKIQRELIIGGARWIILSVVSLIFVSLVSWAVMKNLDTNYGLLVMLMLFGLWSIFKDYVRSGFGQIRDIILKHFGTDDIEADYT